MNIAQLLPSCLRHENIARVEDKVLLVGNRQLLPFCRKEHVCRCAEDSAEAIRSMITQGGGQLETALQTLVLEARLHGRDPQRLEAVCIMLSQARKTNSAVKRELDALRPVILSLPEKGFACSVEEIVQARLEHYDRIYLSLAERGSRLINDGDGILTTCSPEHSFFLSLALARRDGRKFTVYSQETRPYLQGAHLTAPSLAEMGYDHYLICDNMTASVVREKRVSIYLTASDRATGKRWVINKVGTLQSAIVCRASGIGYYAFSMGLDDSIPVLDSFPVEYRSAEEVKKCQNQDITGKDVRALYPAFDIISPEYVTGIITSEGVI